MLNLIKNEYAKIFHKVSTYILLVLLLLSIIGMPLLSLLTDKLSDTIAYFMTYDDEISWAEEMGDKTQAELLKKAKALGIPEKEAFGDSNGWRYSALTDLYYDYWAKYSLTMEDVNEYNEFYEYMDESMEYEQIDDAQKAIYEGLFNKGLTFVENNDWKSYYQFKIDTINADNDLSSEEKIANTYSYKYMIDNDIEPGTGSWQEATLSVYTANLGAYEEMLKLKVEGEYYDEKEFENAKRLTLISKYRLDNNITAAIYEDPTKDLMFDNDIYTFTGKFYNNMKNCISSLMVVLIIALVIAGNIISKEFSQGTIKFLLINPVKRSKIFWSKYLTVFSYAALLSIITFFMEFLMSMIVFGTSELGTKVLIIEGTDVIAKSAFAFMAFRYLLAFVEILIAFTVAFMVSSLFRSSALAIALSFIVYFVGTSVCQVAAMFNLDFFRYTIFAVQDLTSIINGQPSFIHLTTNFALTVIGIHMILLLLTAHDAFTKRNI